MRPNLSPLLRPPPVTSVQDAVQQVENRVVKIAELQEVFTEKVLQQSGEIEEVGRNAVTATENVKDGNEEIRRYSRTDRGRRQGCQPLES